MEPVETTIDGRTAYPALNLVKAIQESSEKNAWVELDTEV